MIYKLLGMVVWKGGKWFLRRRYGSAKTPKGALAGGAAALVLAGILLLLRGRGGGE